MIYSDCCLATWEDGFCRKCNEPAFPMIECKECMGTGVVDVIDRRKVHALTISPPYKTVRCEECGGTGYIMLKYTGDPSDV